MRTYEWILLLGGALLSFLIRSELPALAALLLLFTYKFVFEKDDAAMIMLYHFCTLMVDFPIYPAIALPLRSVMIILLTGLFYVASRNYQRSLIPLLLIAMPLAVSIFFSKSVYLQSTILKSISFLLTYGFFMFFYPSYARLFTDSHRRAIANVTNLLIGISGLSLLVIATPDLSFFRGSGRFSGMFYNPNGLGLFCLLTLGFVYALKERTDLWFTRKRMFNLLVIGIFVLIILTRSRGALLSSIIMVLLFSLNESNKVRILSSTFLVLAFALLLSMIDLQQLAYKLGLVEFLRLENLSDGSGRKHAWAFAIENFLEYPVFGRGMSFGENLFKYEMSVSLQYSGHQGGVHNSFLELLLNFGVFGLTSFIAFWGVMISRSVDKQKALACLLPLFLSASFESWMISSLNFSTPLMLMLMSHMVHFYRPPQQVQESSPGLSDSVNGAPLS